MWNVWIQDDAGPVTLVGTFDDQMRAQHFQRGKSTGRPQSLVWCTEQGSAKDLELEALSDL
ncbi:MAG TPA: hypothetical protein DCQ33_12775 [Nitrospira sp.]|nr:hypothetical protein [Nitrospira sp.]